MAAGADEPERVVIVPCSGIGKTYGSVTRQAAYAVTGELRPDQTRLVALAMLVMGDDAVQAALAAAPAITIDGCKLACATKMVQESGGQVAQAYAVLDVYRRYKQFKPQGIAELNEGGLQLAQALAEEIAAQVDRLQAASSPAGAAQDGEEPQHG
ncbi:MAG: putative zinc-binding protein [Chloroflexota bacterium]